MAVESVLNLGIGSVYAETNKGYWVQRLGFHVLQQFAIDPCPHRFLITRRRLEWSEFPAQLVSAIHSDMGMDAHLTQP